MAARRPVTPARGASRAGVASLMIRTSQTLQARPGVRRLNKKAGGGETGRGGKGRGAAYRHRGWFVGMFLRVMRWGGWTRRLVLLQC